MTAAWNNIWIRATPTMSRTMRFGRARCVPCMRRFRWLMPLLLACSLALSFACTACAQESGEGVIDREYPLKALFLYNFASYVDWPTDTFANDQVPFVIGVLGSTPIDSTLNEIAASKKIAGRTIVIQHYAEVSDLKPCQILFISRSVSQQQQRRAIEAEKDRAVLVVGESENFAAGGGIINFFVQSNKIRFEINVAAAKQQQLKVNSKLLGMAKIVDPNATKK
jgi:hypothetical protein